MSLSTTLIDRFQSNDAMKNNDLFALFAGAALPAAREVSVRAGKKKKRKASEESGETAVAGADNGGAEPQTKKRRKKSKDPGSPAASGTSAPLSPSLPDPASVTAVATPARRVDDPAVVALRNKRTVFFGNVAVGVTSKQLRRLCNTTVASAGAGVDGGLSAETRAASVESVRFRSVAFSSMKLPKKVAFIKGQLHENRSSMSAYVVFTSEEAARAALSLNGTRFHEKTLRVDGAWDEKPTFETARSVFVGNVPFDCEDEELHVLFGDCGPIEGVRVVRDSSTQVGKGIAFVCFKERESVVQAIQLNGANLRDRELRVTRCSRNPGRFKEKKNKRVVGNKSKKNAGGGSGGAKKNAGVKRKKAPSTTAKAVTPRPGGPRNPGRKKEKKKKPNVKQPPSKTTK